MPPPGAACGCNRRKTDMDDMKKQGRFILFLAGAALLLCLAACDGEAPPPPPAAQAPAVGIGPDKEGGGSLMYEEEPAPGFNDHLGQVDYAIAQAVQRSELVLGGLRVSQLPLREEGGHVYAPQSVQLYGIKDVAAMAQALRDSLLAWAEYASLEALPLPYPSADSAAAMGSQPGSANFKIMVDGVVTHYVFISPLPGKAGDTRPRLVIVMDDLGESKRQAARILALDYPVTFAVWPHSTHAGAVARLACEAGAELIIHQPMEPEGYPRVNPGAGVILEGMSADEVRAVLDASFALVPGASGLNNHMGSRLTQNEAAMRLVAAELSARGLLALDSLTHARSRLFKAASEAGAPAFKRDIFLDVEGDKDKILVQLKKAEQVALLKGQAIAIGHPLAATLAALEEWQNTRDKRIAVVRLKDLTPTRPVINFHDNAAKEQ